MKTQTFILEKTATGYSAYSPHLPVYSTGETWEEARQNVHEALQLYFNTDQTLPLRLRMDLGQFFQYYKVLNARSLAERIGMNPSLLSQYIQGQKQPSAKQTQRILEGIRQIGKELASLDFKL